MSTLMNRMMAIAEAEVGVKERPLGSNWGPRVKQYIQSAGYNEPVFWCMCFVYWCVENACKEQGYKNPLPRTGSCDIVLYWAREAGVLYTTPKVGDIFLYIKSANDATHTGIVVAVDDDTLTTIEGNSSASGSRNGIAVVRRARALRKLTFVRWIAATVKPDEFYQLFLGDQTTATAEMPVVRGVSLAPVRPVVEKLGLDTTLLAWDDDAQSVRYDQDLIPGEHTLRDNRAYVPVRNLAAFFGLRPVVDVAGRTVRLVRE